METTTTGLRLTLKGRVYLRWLETVAGADETSPFEAFAAGWEACRQAIEEANPDTPLQNYINAKRNLPA